jgi:hypothetical protein
MNILNLSDAPDDPIERVMWLSGVKEKAAAELEAAFSAAYFKARIERRLPAAIEAGPYAKKRVLAMTRAENNRRGRPIRWNDGMDITSTAYDAT